MWLKADRYENFNRRVEGLGVTTMLKNEKFAKKNTRKARNPRNTYSQFLYPLVFLDLDKSGAVICQEKNENKTPSG
jgi:hypothetical protein